MDDFELATEVDDGESTREPTPQPSASRSRAGSGKGASASGKSIKSAGGRSSGKSEAAAAPPTPQQQPQAAQPQPQRLSRRLSEDFYSRYFETGFADFTGARTSVDGLFLDPSAGAAAADARFASQRVSEWVRQLPALEEEELKARKLSPPGEKRSALFFAAPCTWHRRSQSLLKHEPSPANVRSALSCLNSDTLLGSGFCLSAGRVLAP